MVQGVGAGESDPASIEAGEAAQAVHFLLVPVFLLGAQAPAQQEVHVARAPGEQAEARHAEERIEDLAVDLEPDGARAVDVLAVPHVLAVADGCPAHFGGGAAEDEEEHATPCYDVEAVDCPEEAEGCDEPSPECLEPYGPGFCPG